MHKVKALKSEVEKPVTLGEMIGKSQAMVAVSEEIAIESTAEPWRKQIPLTRNTQPFVAKTV